VSQASFAKRQREKDRKEKAAAKAERRAERQANADSGEGSTQPPVDEAALLTELASLHDRFERGDIDFEDFSAAKDEITQRLQVD
jgi:hypothetical protein